MRATLEDEERPSWSRIPTSGFAIWVFDDNDGTIVAANEAAAHVYGYERADLLGRTVEAICPALADESARHAGTFVHRRKDGSTFEADISIVEAGEVARVSTMVLVHPAGRRG